MITIDEQIRCVTDEIRRRKAAYPKLVASGRMAEKSATAEICRMQRVLETLTQLRGLIVPEPSAPVIPLQRPECAS